MEINRVSQNSVIKNYEIGNAKADGDFAAKLSKAVSDSQAGDDAKLRSACREMEAVFLNLMLSRMRATIPKSDLLPDRSQEEIMQSMLDTELTKTMSQAGGIGLADMIYRQLTLSGTAASNKSQAPK